MAPPPVTKVQDVQLLEGRMWTDGEEERRANVVVLGHDAAEDLFPGESPLGKDVECGGDVFTVIGVLDMQPQPFGSGRNTQDNSAYFPLETFRKIHPEITDYWIVVKYDDPANKEMVTEEVRELLRVRRKLRVEQDDNFAIFSPDSLTRLWNQLTGGLFLFMVAVSCVGLMVGGVGVMNIMLVSRHRAHPRDRRPQSHRRNQEKYPAAVHARGGDAVHGRRIARHSGRCAVHADSALRRVASCTPRFRSSWVVIAFCVSCVIGLVFGIYPAWKAANLDPIEALRYE